MTTRVPSVLPFRALRYAAGSAELERLVSPPYDVIDADEQAGLRARSAYNASYVELPTDTVGQPGSRYRQAAELLQAWRRAGALRLDPRPAYYLSETHYSIGAQTYRRRDLVAAVGVEAWSTGAVLPHEHTMSGPKADRLELLRATHLNASPIWLLHRDCLAGLDAAWLVADARPPDVEFSWRGERHRLWIVDDPSTVAAIQADFDRAGPLYIADGHHRYETSLAFRAEAETNVPGARAVLANLTWASDAGLVVLPTHRLLAGLDASLTLEHMRRRWPDVLHVECLAVAESATANDIDALMGQLAASAGSAPSFGVFGPGDLSRFALVQVRGSLPPGALPSDRSPAWKSLDVSVVHGLVIDPLVAASGRPREAVLTYTRDPYEAFAAVRQGRASLAVLLNATPVDGVLAVADAHDRMPEKSTYFYPKPPAGLVMRDLDARA